MPSQQNTGDRGHLIFLGLQDPDSSSLYAPISLKAGRELNLFYC